LDRLSRISQFFSRAGTRARRWLPRPRQYPCIYEPLSWCLLSSWMLASGSVVLCAMLLAVTMIAASGSFDDDLLPGAPHSWSSRAVARTLFPFPSQSSVGLSLRAYSGRSRGFRTESSGNPAMSQVGVPLRSFVRICSPASSTQSATGGTASEAITYQPQSDPAPPPRVALIIVYLSTRSLKRRGWQRSDGLDLIAGTSANCPSTSTTSSSHAAISPTRSRFS
jgi:hypothetical protein